MIEPGDAVDIISDYFLWKRARDMDPDPTSAENYGHYLEIERELQILKVIRKAFTHLEDPDSDQVRAALTGDSEAIEEFRKELNS